VNNEGDTPSQLLPFSNGWMPALGSKATFVATRSNYLNSAKRFAALYGNAVRGTQNPTDFFKALQKAGFNDSPTFLDPTVLNNMKTRMQCQ
jgi:hypothetical protein